MNPSTIALIIAGTLLCVSLAVTIIYHAGRNAQAHVDEEIINTLHARIHNLTTNKENN